MQRSMGFYDTANLYPDSSIGYLVKVCNQLGMAHLDRAFADEGLSAVPVSYTHLTLPTILLV